MDFFEIGIAVWVILQIPFAVALAKKRKNVPSYSTWLLVRAALPLSHKWEGQVKDEDLDAIREYR